MDVDFNILEDAMTFRLSPIEARNAAMLMELVLHESLQNGTSVPVFKKNFFSELSVIDKPVVIEFRSCGIFFGLRFIESIINDPMCDASITNELRLFHQKIVSYYSIGRVLH